MYNVHLTHSLLCFEFVEFTLNQIMNLVGYDFDFGYTCHFNVTLIGLRLQGKGRR